MFFILDSLVYVIVLSMNDITIDWDSPNTVVYILIRCIPWSFTILQNDNITISWDLFRLSACPGMAAGAVSLRKSHDIIILLLFCNIVKGQAN